MGICEYSPDKNIVYSTKSLLDKTSSGPKTPNFYFSTEPLSKLDGDCLLILSKDYTSIKGNKFIKGLHDKASAAKLCKQYHSQYTGRREKSKEKEKIGELVMFSAYISGVEVNKFAVMGLAEHEFQDCQENQNQIVRNSLHEKVRANIETISGEGVRNLVITEFEWKSLISKLNIFKLLCKVIIESQAFKSVVFACIHEESQLLYMKTVQEMRQEGGK